MPYMILISQNLKLRKKILMIPNILEGFKKNRFIFYYGKIYIFIYNYT